MSTGKKQSWLIRVLQGALIGVGAILPGISGGVLCVVMGIYEPMIEFLAHPFRQFKKHAAFFIPILLGLAVGVLGLARVVDWLFRTSPTPAVWLFIGLVAGTLPSLYRQAGSKGRSAGSWLAMALGAALMLGWMLYLRIAGQSQVQPSIGWWLLCGVLWGLGVIVPGMSPSSFFIFLGLYQPLSAGIADLNLSVIVPLGIGMLASISLLANFMQKLLDKAYPLAMNAIFGIVVASTLGILPLGEVKSWGEIAIYAGCFIAGYAVAYGMDAMSGTIESRGNAGA